MRARVQGPCRRAVAGLAVVVVAPLAAACGGSSTTTSASPTSVSVPAKVTTPPTTAKKKNAACGISDRWSYAFLTLNSAPTSTIRQGQTIPTPSLDDAAAKFKAAVPELSQAIDVRTALLKKRIIGMQMTAEDRQRDKQAAETIGRWYDPQC